MNNNRVGTVKNRRCYLKSFRIGAFLALLVFMSLFLSMYCSYAESPKGIVVLFKDKTGKELCKFKAELAVTPEEQSLGLMFRKDLDPDSGMLFVNNSEHMRFFWMKNTYIPLDILFISGNNEVKHIHFGAKPLDETAISSQYPVQYVFEINAGEAKKCKISQGSRMIVFRNQR